jgi:hypothetical protein
VPAPENLLAPDHANYVAFIPETADQTRLRQALNIDRERAHNRAQYRIGLFRMAYQQLVLYTYKTIEKTSYGEIFRLSLPISEVTFHEARERLSMALAPTSLTESRANIADALSKTIPDHAPIVAVVGDFRKTVSHQRQLIRCDADARQDYLPDALAIQYLIQNLRRSRRFRKLLKSLNDLDFAEQNNLETILTHLLENAHLVDDDDHRRPAAHAIEHTDSDSDSPLPDGDAAVTRAQPRTRKDKNRKPAPAIPKGNKSVKEVKDPDDTVLLLPLSNRHLARAQRRHLTFGASSHIPTAPINVQYCWSHGICQHSSKDCREPNPGHQRAATTANMMGGNPAIDSRLTRRPNKAQA